MNKFSVAMMDWPSNFKTYSDAGRGRNAEKHYDGVLDWDAMRAFPIDNVLAGDAALFAWVTWPTMKIQTDIIESWGFKYVTCAFNWIKFNKNQTDKPFMGMGYWTRGNSEPCLLFTRGKNLERLSRGVQQVVVDWEEEEILEPQLTMTAVQEAEIARAIQISLDLWKGPMWEPRESLPRVTIEEHIVPTGWATESIGTPIQAHSVKPEAVQDRIEQLLHGPYLELFARRHRPGWTCVGNALDGRDIFDVIAEWGDDDSSLQRTVGY